MQSRTDAQVIPAIPGAAKLASLLDFRPGSMVFVGRNHSGDVCQEPSQRIPFMGAINDHARGRGRRESPPERGFAKLRLFWRSSRSYPQRAGRPSASARTTLTRVSSSTRGRKRRWQVSRRGTLSFGNSDTGLRYARSIARLRALGGCRATIVPTVGVAWSAAAVSAISHGVSPSFRLPGAPVSSTPHNYLIRFVFARQVLKS